MRSPQNELNSASCNYRINFNWDAFFLNYDDHGIDFNIEVLLLCGYDYDERFYDLYSFYYNKALVLKFLTMCRNIAKLNLC